MDGRRWFKVICIDAVCGWISHRRGDNRTEAEKGGCDKCQGAVVAQKR